MEDEAKDILALNKFFLCIGRSVNHAGSETTSTDNGMLATTEFESFLTASNPGSVPDAVPRF